MTPRLPISPLDAHLGYWLRFVSNHVSHAFSLKLQRYNVTVAEWVILRELYDERAMAPSELATQTGMTRGAISKLVDRLIAKYLIVRSLSDTDRRYQALTLTQAGRALVPKLAAAADRNDAEFFDHLSPEDRSKIENAMREIVRRSGLKSVPAD